MDLLRYPKRGGFNTARDPLADLLELLNLLTAKAYLLDILTTANDVPLADARKRAPHIIPHVRTAAGFLEQALQGSSDLSLLPAYYAVLNLLKVYILFSPMHAALSRNMRHGASYDVDAKDSQNLLTERVTLHSRGVIPLDTKSSQVQL
jgi:hypothetical protein